MVWSTVIIEWLITILFSLIFSLSYYSYVAIKRRFDSIYNEKSLFIKRAIHGVVYIIFLILLNEAIKVKAYMLGKYSSALVFFLNIVFVAIGIPIFLDMVLSIYKEVRGSR